ncbi:MAG: FtsX-like permease family protein [Pseudomonadota bacterium]
MRALFARIEAALGFNQGADRIVPPTGFTASATIFASAAMAFLAVFALAFSFATARLAQTWTSALAQTATVRISAPADQAQAQLAQVLEILDQTPGVASARALSEEDQQVLLTPWLGPDVPVDLLPVPQLVEIAQTPDGFDAAGLRLRLQGEVPGAVLDDHSQWRKPMVASAQRMRWVGYVALGLITATAAVIISLAAHAALAANKQVITTLRLVGADDGYIKGAFVRRFTLRAVLGAVFGMLAGLLLVAFVPTKGTVVLTGLAFVGSGWLWPLLIPFICAGVSLLATHFAARSVLENLS